VSIDRQLAFNGPAGQSGDRFRLGGFPPGMSFSPTLRPHHELSAFRIGRRHHAWERKLDWAIVKPHADLTHPPNVSHPATHENRGMTFVNNFLHSIEAFLLEDSVSDRQYFIEDDDFRV
jgi:hypothetical protein